MLGEKHRPCAVSSNNQADWFVVLLVDPFSLIPLALSSIPLQLLHPTVLTR